MAIDTACSSSLVSVHQACQSLRSHESDLAIAGGVNLILAPENTIAVCRTRALSPGGRCKTFDESADGFTRSEGCGIVILKLLSSAIADKDRVLAVIRGSAVNQDGASSGFTVPNGNAQQAVIRQALGGINPLDVDYVEAHGTGTALGDPVEVLSLAAVFGKERPQTKPLLVGSVKTNIGHAESAAGIASLIKVVLGLNKEEIPPSLHFKKPNPHVPWGELPISVCESLRPWPRTRKPRIAGVSAFGASGTNAHLIVEEAPEIESAPPPTERPFHVLTLSAKSDAALRDLAARYKDYLVSDPRESISDICFTANTGRSHFRHRLALVCSSAEDAGRKLADFLEDKSTAFIHHSGADAAADYSELPPELNRLAARLPKAGNVLALGSFSQEQNDWRETLNNLARLYCMGTDLDWEGLDRGYERRRVSLPTYPFQRKRFWISEGKAEMEEKDQTASQAAPRPQRQQKIQDALRELIAKLLETDIDQIDVHMQFLEMGADSIVLVEAVHTIESEFGIKVNVRQLFEELFSINALATYLDQQMPTEEQSPSPLPAEQTVTAVAAVAPQSIPQPPAAGDSLTALERILSEQNRFMAQFMNQQLEIVRHAFGGGVPPVAVEQPEAVATQTAKTAITQTAKAAAPPPARAESPRAPLPWGNSPERQSRGMTEQQQRHLDSLIARYTERTRRSKEQAAAWRLVLADSRASVGFRFSTKEMLYPITGVRSQGSRVWDIDGNEYIDFTMGFGVHLFGHQPPFINEAVAEEFKCGLELGARSRWAGEVAQLICDLTGHERVAFSNSGTEAVMTALRLARAGTGRDKVAIFTNSYHGHSDGTLARAVKVNGHLKTLPMAPGVPASAVENVLVLDYCTDDALNVLRACGNELAAVMVEPVQSRHLSLDPQEFLRKLREITLDSGAALIFDEMITGFRVHPGGAQALFGIRADLATYGKIVGGGLPIGVIAGSSRFMDGIDGGMWNYNDASFPDVDRTAFGGTFCQHPLAMAGARAVLRHLKEEGPALQARLNARTAEIANHLNGFFSENEIPIRVVHFGSLFRLEFSSNLDLLFYHLLEKGIYIWEWRSCFLSTAHTDRDIEYFIKAVRESVAELQDGGFLPKRAGTQKSIALAERRIPLSEAQKQLWLATQIDRNCSVAYNVNTTLELSGPLDIQALGEAITRVVGRHEALRTCIDPAGEEQVVQASPQFRVPLHDLSKLAGEEAKGALHRWRTEESRRPFDLTRAPLFRANIVKVDDGLHVLSLTAHHIITDGATMGILLEEIAAGYAQACGSPIEGLKPSMQFAEYLALCEDRRHSAQMAEHEEYWLSLLEDSIPALQLPCDKVRSKVPTFRGDRLTLRFDAELASKLRSVARENAATLYMALLAGFTLMLHRVTGQSDLIVGTPVSGRHFPGSNRVAGYCAHLLPLRSRLRGSGRFVDHLRGTRKILLDAFEHQEFPFAEIVRKRREQQDVVNTPIVSVIFNLEPVSALPKLPGVELRLMEQITIFTAFDLSLNVIDSGKELVIDCDYSTDLFEEATARRLLGVYETVLRAIAENPSTETGRVPLLTEPERNQLLVEWNDTGDGYAGDACIHRLIEAQAARTPDAIALVCGAERLTYRELDQQANRLANHLIDMGVMPETLVGVCLQRTPRMMISLIAILKAGGAYVPLDPSYPRQRLAFMMEDARIRLTVTERALAPVLPETPLNTINLDTINLDGFAVDAPTAALSPDNLAYVIYTSGSTGRPKGVAITHRSVANLLEWARTVFSTDQLAGVLATSSICFDASVFELFVPLSRGGKLILAQNALELPSLPCAEEVTFISTVSSSMAELVKNGGVPKSARTVILIGEPVHRQVVDKLYELEHIDYVYDLYGPTEATVYSTFALTEGQDARDPAIGRPIINTQVYVLDENLEPLPVGVAGELYIGGGLARGYLNRPERTGERFIPNPFSDEPGARLYKTSDRVRYRADGNLEFMGRIDRQIKLRGFRIELGEIEAALFANNAVEKAVAILADDLKGGKRLIAYVVPAARQTVAADELRRHLRERLPDFMIPSMFVVVEELPLLPNGKVDRSRLKEPDYSTTYVPPSNEVEEALVSIYETALGKDRIGALDDFFAAGGNSLSATQVASQIYKKLNRKIEVKLLFANPTVRELAKRITRFEWTQYAPITPIPECDAYEMSPAQRRFWIQDRIASPGVNRTQPVAFLLEGDLDAHAFGRAFKTLIERHEILRTEFFMDGKEPKQRVLGPEESEFEIKYVDLSETDDHEALLREHIYQEACAPMDLSKGRLLRVKLVKIEAGKHACVCSMHHIVTDGWSNVVLLNEFIMLYAAYCRGGHNPLPPLAVQYKDYAAWLNNSLTGPKLEDLREYWRGQLSGHVPPAWELPTDFERYRAKNYQRRVHRFTISDSDAAGLERLSHDHGATLFMGLLACLKSLLYRYTGYEDIIVGTPVAGRVHPDLEGQIGPYLNVLPLRDFVRGDDRFIELLKLIRETTLDAYAHQIYPFDFMLTDVGLKRDSRRNPIFDVGFTLQNQNELAMRADLTGLKMTQIPDLEIDTENPEALTDFWFVAERHESGLDMRIVYNASLYKHSTVEQMGLDLSTIIQATTKDPQTMISDISLASQAEPPGQKVTIDIAFSRG
jgi:amino acid adenylation domain-containing protein